MSALSEVTDEILRLDDEIEQLRDARSDRTDRLERLAHVWDERYPEPKSPRTAWSRLRCTRCYFRFDRVVDGQVRFGTDCTYCGRDSGDGVAINVEWFERALQAENDTSRQETRQ